MRAADLQSRGLTGNPVVELRSEARAFALQGGDLIVREMGRSWLYSGGAWMELTGVLAEELTVVLDGGAPGARLEALARSGLPGADRLLEVARAPRRELGSAGLLVDRPSILFVELTDRCPLACAHCYAEAGAERDTFMGQDLAADLIDQAGELGFGRVQLTGGEPLLHPGLAGLASRALEAGIGRVEIFTSGIGLEPSLLAKVPAATTFAVSVYSCEPAVHDRITGVPGSLEATLGAIDLLLERGFTLRVATILLAENAPQWTRTRQALVERGVAASAVRASLLSGTGRGANAPAPEQLPDDVLGDAADPEPAHQPWSWPGKAAVSATGRVFPCIFARWLELGDLRQRSLAAILERPSLPDLPELPVPKRWRYCSERLSCPDCRMLAFGLMGSNR